MVEQPVIELANIAKRFVVRPSRPTLLELLRQRARSRREMRDHWALQDVSLAIERGERVGLVGGNGSGKTTLLRIMAGIYRPTRGAVRLREEAAGFLQVGAGMHRDLSALENAYLFGAVMGLGRASVRRKLPEIVAFAELEGFMHAPLRDLSLGMVQRLGLALLIAAELDLLLLDELLSGADARFVEKTLQALERGSARQTMVLSSHDTSVLRRLCTRAILLERGRVTAAGPTEEVLERYLGAGDPEHFPELPAGPSGAEP